MFRPMMLIAALFVATTLDSAATGDEMTKADFQEFCKAMVGEWQASVTLVQDLAGIGKSGDKKEVRSVNAITVNGHAIVGNGSDGNGTATSLIYFDPMKKQIRGTTVFSGGTVITGTYTKKDGKWVNVSTAVHPDGTKSRGMDTLDISDGGNTHTWTRGDVSNVWRRTSK